MGSTRIGKKRVDFSGHHIESLLEAMEPRRLLSAGQLDPSFGNSGAVTVAQYPDFNITAVAVQADGKVLAAGNGGANNTTTAIERFNTDGSIDKTFGSAGKVSVSLGGAKAFVNKILVEASGKILCVGNTRDSLGNDDMAMARLNTDGSFDTSFGGTGKISFDAGGNDDELSQAAESLNGTIVIGGSSGDSGTLNAFVARIHDADGSFDTSFSSDGKSGIDFLSLDDSLTGMAVLSNGQIDIATESTGYVKKLGLARINANGSLDNTFSGDGKTTDTSFLTAGMFASSGNKLLVFGAQEGTPEKIQVRRYNSDGSVDKNFGTNGRADVAQSNVASLSDAVAEADGKFLLAGATTLGATTAQVQFVIRVNANGVIDNTFTPPSFIGSSNTASVQTHLAIGADQRPVLAIDTFANTNPPSGAATLFRMLGDTTPTITKGALTISGTANNDSIILATSALDDGTLIGVSINNAVSTFNLSAIKSISIDGGAGDDSIVLTALGKLNLPITVAGGTGDDIIMGTAGPDSLDGGIGDDTIHGAGGDDNINGEAGNDQLFGDKGDDTITGEAGTDNLSGGSGDDVLRPVDGEADTVNGDDGNDTADYSNESANLSLSLDGIANDGASGEHDNLLGIENVYGGAGNDRITGNVSDNFLYGESGNDTIHGLAGNDTLKGGSGHDHLFGDDGADFLIANDFHSDTLDGGAGTDGAKVDLNGLDSVTSVETLV